MENSHVESVKERLVEDFKAMLADAEALLNATATDASVHVAALRRRVEENLQRAKHRLEGGEADLQKALVEELRTAARSAESYIRDNPWQALGIATALAFALGFLVNRR